MAKNESFRSGHLRNTIIRANNNSWVFHNFGRSYTENEIIFTLECQKLKQTRGLCVSKLCKGGARPSSAVPTTARK